MTMAGLGVHMHRAFLPRCCHCLLVLTIPRQKNITIFPYKCLALVMSLTDTGLLFESEWRLGEHSNVELSRA
jgi:hypothetical protein